MLNITELLSNITKDLENLKDSVNTISETDKLLIYPKGYHRDYFSTNIHSENSNYIQNENLKPHHDEIREIFLNHANGHGKKYHGKFKIHIKIQKLLQDL